MCYTVWIFFFNGKNVTADQLISIFIFSKVTSSRHFKIII